MLCYARHTKDVLCLHPLRMIESAEHGSDDGSDNHNGKVREKARWLALRSVVRERLVTKGGIAVDLGARTLDLLIALISSPNEVVSKKDLMSRVWPDVIVEAGSLRLLMYGLRKALGDGKDGTRYIATLP